MKRLQLVFKVIRGDTWNEVRVSDQIIKIGSYPTSAIVVEGVARIHAVIEAITKDSISITDLGSNPITTVNGIPINKINIKPGDNIRIGATLIQFYKVELIDYGDKTIPISMARPLNINEIESEPPSIVGPKTDGPPAIAEVKFTNWDKERSRVWMEAYKLVVQAEVGELKIYKESESYSDAADKITQAWEKRFPKP